MVVAGALVLLLGLFSNVFKDRWYLTEPLAAFLLVSASVRSVSTSSIQLVGVTLRPSCWKLRASRW